MSNAVLTQRPTRPAMEGLERRRLLTTFYVSAHGDDGNAGSSPGQAWQTIKHVNQHTFAAGDRILFQGGDRFGGRLYFGPNDAGTATNPLLVGTYGIGRATILADVSGGIFVYDTGGISISNLRIVGPGVRARGNASGISFFTNLANGARLQHVYVNNVEASGFVGAGISVASWSGHSGFSDVRITNCSLHDNLEAGLATYAQMADVHQNVYIGHVQAFNNAGNRTKLNSGSGIMLGGVHGAVVEYSVVRDNAIHGDGAVGIWAYDSSNVIFQHNESCRNHTSGGNDGDGYDFDRNVRNSVMQYNWVHDNDGSGFEMAQNGKAGRYFNNTLRFNSSENDGRKNGYGGLDIWGPVANCTLENNIVYSTGAGSTKAIRIINGTSGLRLRNNYFQSTTGPLVLDIAPGQTNLIFADNSAIAPSNAVKVTDGYTVYPDLKAWTVRFAKAA